MRKINCIGLLKGVKQEQYDNVGFDGKKLDEFHITASASSYKEMEELINFLRIQQKCFYEPINVNRKPMDKSIQPKYKKGDKVWVNVKSTLPMGSTFIDFTEIVDVLFNEDSDVHYAIEKYRGPFQYIYLEGELFPSEEELKKSSK